MLLLSFVVLGGIWRIVLMYHNLSSLLLNESVLSKHAANCDNISEAFDVLLKVLFQAVYCSSYGQGECAVPSTGHAHGYLHSTRMSCASLLLCAVAVWGWLVHGTSLKIDIRSLARGGWQRTEREWKRMREQESVTEMEKDEGGRKSERKNARKMERKKERKKGRHKILCTKLVLKGNKHAHIWEFEMETEGENEYFSGREWARFPGKVNGDRCRQERCGPDDRYKGANRYTVTVHLIRKETKNQLWQAQ